MTHELLKGRRWYSTHGELEPKVVAKAMYQRVVGQMRSCCLGQTKTMPKRGQTLQRKVQGACTMHLAAASVLMTWLPTPTASGQAHGLGQ